MQMAPKYNLTITPEQDGAWTVTLTVPDDINPGEHEFTATAVNNGVESELSNRGNIYNILCTSNRRPW